MKRILTIILLLLCMSIAGNAQKNIFTKMPVKQRDSTLIDAAKKALLKYAPDYYREYKMPEINFGKTSPDKGLGRFFYEITFFYDPQKEKYFRNYIAKVYIGADNGKVFMIEFMNQMRFDVEGAEKDGLSPIIPFWVQQSKKGKSLPTDSTKRVKVTTSKTYEFPK